MPLAHRLMRHSPLLASNPVPLTLQRCIVRVYAVSMHTLHDHLTWPTQLVNRGHLLWHLLRHLKLWLLLTLHSLHHHWFDIRQFSFPFYTGIAVNCLDRGGQLQCGHLLRDETWIWSLERVDITLWCFFLLIWDGLVTLLFHFKIW